MHLSVNELYGARTKTIHEDVQKLCKPPRCYYKNST